MRVDLNTSSREELIPGSTETTRTAQETGMYYVLTPYAGDEVSILEQGTAGSSLRS